MSDTLTGRSRFRTANVIDDANRECLGILASISLPSRRIAKWPENIAAWRGYPKAIRVDNGSKNISRYFKEWAEKNDIEILYVQPGKPAQNDYIERINLSYREAILYRYILR